MSKSIAGTLGYASAESPYIVDDSQGLTYPELIDKFLPLPDILHSKSVPLPGSAVDGYSPVYRSGYFPDGLKKSLAPGLETLGKVFKNSAEHYGDLPLFSYRDYDYSTKESSSTISSITYKQADELKKSFGAGLLYLLQSNKYKDALRFESHAKIDNHLRDYQTYNELNISFILTVFSANRYEWILTDLTCCSYAITNTALYDTLGPETSAYILGSTESPVIVATKDHVTNLLDLKVSDPESVAAVILIVSMDPLFSYDAPLIERARSLNIILVDLNQVAKVGEIFPLEELIANEESLYTLSFTSGTTGSNPKGVALSNTTAVAGALFPVSQLPHVSGKRAFCFLPFAHIYERQSALYHIMYGGNLAFPRMNATPLNLVEDLKLFKPNVMCNVPRVYTKMESALKAGTLESPSSIKAGIFSRVFATKAALQRQYPGTLGSHFLYDNVVLSQLRKLIGFENMEIVVSGSAPISPSTVNFLKTALNIGVGQGYGLTESFAGFSIDSPFNPDVGTCGGTGVSVEMRIRALPEMGYNLTDEGGPRGELLLRGPQIFSYYFKNEEETSKSFDADGWFCTGDVAQITATDGKLKIIDRVKNFFKLAQGEYVTPEKVENAYLSTSTILSQCFAHGDSFKSFLVGIIGIEKASLIPYLTKQLKINISSLNTDEKILAAINKPENKKALLLLINQQTVGKIQGFEKFHNIYIEFEPLQLLRNVLTPTTKIKRPIAAKYFAEQINHMYEVEGSLLNGSRL